MFLGLFKSSRVQDLVPVPVPMLTHAYYLHGFAYPCHSLVLCTTMAEFRALTWPHFVHQRGRICAPIRPSFVHHFGRVLCTNAAAFCAKIQLLFVMWPPKLIFGRIFGRNGIFNSTKRPLSYFCTNIHYIQFSADP